MPLFCFGERVGYLGANVPFARSAPGEPVAWNLPLHQLSSYQCKQGQPIEAEGCQMRNKGVDMPDLKQVSGYLDRAQHIGWETDFMGRSSPAYKCPRHAIKRGGKSECRLRGWKRLDMRW
jgi:hypothetical protein